MTNTEKKQIERNIRRMEKEQERGEPIEGTIVQITDVLKTKHPQL